MSAAARLQRVGHRRGASSKRQKNGEREDSQTKYFDTKEEIKTHSKSRLFGSLGNLGRLPGGLVKKRRTKPESKHVALNLLEHESGSKK